MASKTPKPSISRIFIPNRGEIACRIIAACDALSITPILGFSAADRNTKAARLCIEKICIGDAEASASYLNIPAIIAAAKQMRADAIHPGYGFLAENTEFVSACAKAKIVFIGPSQKAMRRLGDKVEAKKIAKLNRIPLLEGLVLGSRDIKSIDSNRKLHGFLEKSSLPLLVKAAAGGGGRGMRVIEHLEHAREQILAASREAETFFKDGTVFIEPYVIGARHVEVQVIADRYGKVAAIGTRDCSLQRRHQKIIEEAPALFLSTKQERALCHAAEKLVAYALYNGLATVEFLVTKKGAFYFLEVNTRLQVEHPVTELSLGVDLVNAQIKIANGEPLLSALGTIHQQPRHAIEVRICSEKPEHDFQAATGQLQVVKFPHSSNLRIDSGFEEGDIVSHYYDSLLAKVIVTGESRHHNIAQLSEVLQKTVIAPLPTNISALRLLLANRDFHADTHSLLTTDQVLKDYKSLVKGQLHHSLVAACLLYLFSSDTHALSSPRSAWDVLGSWSSVGAINSLLHLRLDKDIWTVSVSVENDLTTCLLSDRSGSEFSFQCHNFSKFSDGTFSCFIEESKIAGRGEKIRECLFRITLKQIDYCIEFGPPPRPKRVQSTTNTKCTQVIAHLPGRLVSLYVDNGTVVIEGQPLFVLESMKMEHAVYAEKAGRISQQNCAVGETVDVGKVLFIIEHDKNDSKDFAKGNK